MLWIDAVEGDVVCLSTPLVWPFLDTGLIIVQGNWLCSCWIRHGAHHQPTSSWLHGWWGRMAEKQEPSDSISVLMAVVKPGSCVTCMIAAHGSGHLLGNSTLSWYSV